MRCLVLKYIKKCLYIIISALLVISRVGYKFVEQRNCGYVITALPVRPLFRVCEVYHVVLPGFAVACIHFVSLVSLRACSAIMSDRETDDKAAMVFYAAAGSKRQKRKPTPSRMSCCSWTICWRLWMRWQNEAWNHTNTLVNKLQRPCTLLLMHTR